MKDKRFAVLIAILVIAGMLMGGIGNAFAEPNYVLSGRDKVGTFGKDGKSARLGYINTSVFEGTTYDTFKTWLSAVDPTGTNIILLQDGSGTLSFTTDAFAGDLADTKIIIGDGDGEGAAQTMSGAITISNTGDTTLQPDEVLSSNIAIANVQASDIFFNTVVGTIPIDELGTQVTVESGSILIQTQKVAGFSNDVTLTNSTFSGTTWIINTDAGQGEIVWGLFIRP